MLLLLLVEAVRSGAPPTTLDAVLGAPASLPGTNDAALGLKVKGLALGLSLDDVFFSSAGSAGADDVAVGAAGDGKVAGAAGEGVAAVAAGGGWLATAAAPLGGAASVAPLCCCFQS